MAIAEFACILKGIRINNGNFVHEFECVAYLKALALNLRWHTHAIIYANF